MMNHKTTILHILLLTLFVSAAMGREAAPAKGKHQVRKESFGKTGDGRPVDLYTLTNSKGLEVRTMTYGGIIVSLRVPDKNGNLGDIVLGHDKARRISGESSLLRRHRRTLRQPHRQRHLHSRRREIYPGQK